MGRSDWEDRSNRCLSFHLEPALESEGGLLLMINGWWEPAGFHLPSELGISSAMIELDERVT